jgi:biopolymer transport protein ExbD
VEEKEFNYINVIPLVDIMLVLLTIVLVTATFIVEGSLPVNLPRSKNAEVKNIKAYQIIITKEGEFYFEKRKLSLKELERVIQTLDPEAQISISADKAAAVQKLIEVLDLLKKYGLKKVLIKTEIIR